jgi:eukaryotic-like serine/threonine-protein kinase
MAEELSTLALIASLRREQQRSWQSGERVAAEVYLQRHPQLQADADAALELIYNEIMIRQRLGEAPRLEEYQQRFPPLAARLELLLDVHAALETCPLPEETGLFEEADPTGPLHREATDTPPIPGYEMIRELGRGGMGVVYLVRQKSLNRTAALKMLLAGGHAGDEQCARFHTEAEALARLRHPNIALIYEVGESEGRPYLVMEYVNGGSLASRLAGAPWPIREAAFLVETLAQAIHQAHDRGIVHRDLTPGNVLLALEGEALPDSGKNGSARDTPSLERCIPKITDFGLAKLYLAEGEARTQSGVIMGTPSYMAPEQAEGRSREVSPAADIYALGAILYEMLTGRPPFRAETALETLLQVHGMEPVPPSRLRPKLPADLETICLKCLHKDASKRYGSALALSDDLRRFLAGEPIRARRVSGAERAWRWCRRNPALASLMAAVAALLIAATVGAMVAAVQYRLKAQVEALAKEDLETKQEELETTLYFQRIALAHRELLENNLLKAEELLDQCPDNRRAWEWYYLKRLCHAEPVTIRGQRGGVEETVAFSPDGRRLASLSREGIVNIYDATRWSEQPLFNFRAHKISLRGNLAFSHDGKQLVVPGNDYAVNIWDVTTTDKPPSAPQLSLHGHTAQVWGVAYSPDGRWVASGGEDNAVKLWNAQTGDPVRTFRGHTSVVSRVAFSPDGRRLASASFDKTVKVWDLTVLGAKTDP